MNIIKKLAVLVIATAIVLTGCSNSFSGTKADVSLLAKQNSGNSGTPLGLTTTDIDVLAPLSAILNPAQQIITLDFGTDIIDYATIPNAVVIRNLTAAQNATSPYGQGTTITFTVSEIRDNVAYLLLSTLAGASSTIEVQVLATELTGWNGARQLDSDNDHVQGEADDDDLYINFAVNGGAPIGVGVTRNPRAGMNVPIGAFSATLPATTLNTYITTYNRQGLGGIDLADYKALFDAHLVIETYTAATNEWAPVTFTSLYAAGSGQYTCTFTALAAGTQVRARAIDLQTIETTAAFYGFVQHATTDAQITQKNLATGSVSDPTELDPTAGSEQDNAFYVYTEFTNNYNGKVIINIDNTDLGNLGLDFATFTPANVRIYNSDSKRFIPFTAADVSFGYGPGVFPAVATAPKTQIVINLAPGYKDSHQNYQLWVGPGLKSLGDAAPGTIVPMHFGDATQLDDIPYGFSIIAGDVGTI